MVRIYGMSDKIGPIVFGEREELVFLGRELGEHANYSDKTAAEVDEEVSKIIHDSEKKAHDVLTKNRLLLKKITTKLLKDETIEGAEFDKMFK